MILTHHREKLINAIIYFAKKTKYCGKTKLLKLLYYLDFWHFKETGKSVTGLYYSTWEMGPVPTVLFKELSNMNFDLASSIKIVKTGNLQKIAPLKNFDLKFMTKREKRILYTVVEIFRDSKAEEMVDSTHLNNSPWDTTIKEKGYDVEIDYLLALDNDANSLKLNDVIDRNKERQEMYNAFGVSA